MCHLVLKPLSITLILMKFFFFKFQRSEEKDGEVSSDDIKTGDCHRNKIKQVSFFDLKEASIITNMAIRVIVSTCKHLHIFYEFSCVYFAPLSPVDFPT